MGYEEQLAAPSAAPEQGHSNELGSNRVPESQVEFSEETVMTEYSGKSEPGILLSRRSLEPGGLLAWDES